MLCLPSVQDYLVYSMLSLPEQFRIQNYLILQGNPELKEETKRIIQGNPELKEETTRIIQHGLFLQFRITYNTVVQDPELLSLPSVQDYLVFNMEYTTTW